MGREHTFDAGSGTGLGSDPFGLRGLLEGAAKAVGVDPTLESGETLMGAAVALEELRGLVEAASARVLGQLAAAGVTDAAVGMRTGGWLAWAADGFRVKCRQRVNLAKRLGWFALFGDALVERRVSYAHVEVLCSVANPRNRDGLIEAQASLIDCAAEFPLEQWARLVRRLATDLDSDGSYDPNDDLDANRLRVTPSGDGTADISGRLTGDTAVTVNQTLESLADELFNRFRRDAQVDPSQPMPSRATLMALALAEACRRARAVDLDSSRQPGVEATVVIDIDIDIDSEQDPVVADLAGNSISAVAADALLVDPTIRAMIFDADGVPLRLGRRARLATADQKHALALRDGGCVFPGCDLAPGWCDAHHQPAWALGGQTDIEAMFLLCRHHHRVTHRKGWSCEPDTDPDRPQMWTWTTPEGRQLHSQRKHRRRDQPG